MSFPAYDSYKESGAEWLRQVPSHWEVQRLKAELHEIDVRAGDRPLELLGLSKTAGIVPRSGLAQGAAESDNYGKYKEVRPGDLVMNKMQAWNGVFGLSALTGMVSPDYSVFSVRRASYASFICEALRTDMAAGEMFTRCRGMGIAFLRLNSSDFLDVRIALPPENEVHAIAAFLDRETGKIDALVEAQTRLIELLKEKRQAVISHAVTKGLDPAAPMKDSGVEWLGQVPAHWRISKLKFVARIQTGVAKGKTYEQGDTCVVPYLRVANVQDGWIDLTDVATIELPAADVDRYRLRAGDVLMNEGGDFDKLGRGAVWDGAIDPCVHQNHVFSVRPVAVSPEWLDLTTSSDAAQFFFMRRSKQSTNLASISSTSVMELPILVPPPDEQDSIVDHVARATRKLNDLMSGTAAAINLLQERRAALISAAVTGKIDVRGRAAQQAEAA